MVFNIFYLSFFSIKITQLLSDFLFFDQPNQAFGFPRLSHSSLYLEQVTNYDTVNAFHYCIKVWKFCTNIWQKICFFYFENETKIMYFEVREFVNAYKCMCRRVPLLALDVLRDEVAVVVLQSHLGLGRLVQGVPAESNGVLSRCAHLQDPCKQYTIISH